MIKTMLRLLFAALGAGLLGLALWLLVSGLRTIRACQRKLRDCRDAAERIALSEERDRGLLLAGTGALFLFYIAVYAYVTALLQAAE